MRDPPSGDQKDGGEYLRVAEGEPRRLVLVVGLGVAGIDAGDEPCGCRGTGVVETVAREHGEERARVLRVPGVAVKLMATVVWPLDGRSLVGDELVRRRVRVSFVRWLQRSRERGEDGKVAMLTAVATEQAARSEASCCSGDGGGDLRR